jgi:hypothetical protein
MSTRKLARPRFCAGAGAELLPPPRLSFPELGLPVTRRFTPESAALEQLIEVLYQLILHGSEGEPPPVSTPCVLVANE